MSISYTALKTELTTNPNAYTGTDGLTLTQLYTAGADQACADVLNLVRAAIQIKRADISPSEIFHALDLVDMITNPGATTNSYMESVLTAPFPIRLQNDDGSDTPVQTNLLTLLKTGTTATKTRLAALRTRNGSRAEQLFGAFTTLMAADIVQARAS